MGRGREGGKEKSSITHRWVFKGVINAQTICSLIYSTNILWATSIQRIPGTGDKAEETEQVEDVSDSTCLYFEADHKSNEHIQDMWLYLEFQNSSAACLSLVMFYHNNASSVV